MTRLCIIADTHGKHRELTIPECDLLIHCGDFCNIGQQEQETFEDVDAWFAEIPAGQIICIGGNHDALLQNREFRFSQATYLEDGGVEVGRLKVYGSPWCPDLAGFAFYSEEQDLMRRWRQIPEGIDILVTHTPPFGVLDVASSGDIHLGCPHLRRELERIRPQIHAFGHVHASAGHLKESGVHFVNAAVVGSPAGEVRNSPVTITVDY